MEPPFMPTPSNDSDKAFANAFRQAFLPHAEAIATLMTDAQAKGYMIEFRFAPNPSGQLEVQGLTISKRVIL